MNKKIKIGVIGVSRGTSMINFCAIYENAELVAICDKYEEGLKKHQERFKDHNITYYTDYDEFLKHDMDAVVLANYANEHAPFAIKAMKAGKHVFSEVLPCQTMKEAVELVECVEETGLVYAYGENFCYMPATSEMRRLYRLNKIGEFEYGECEYVHNCEPIWHSITYGDKTHWRNNMYSTFYCTHSLGPIIHATGLRPVCVTGFESTLTTRSLRVGSKKGQFGIEMITLENGGIIKSIHGDLYKDSYWYSMYGSKGRMESAREDSKKGVVNRIYVNADDFDGQYGKEIIENYKPVKEFSEIAQTTGHYGGDFYSMYYFVEKLRGNEDADIIDVYEALDMFLPGMFAYRSILNGGITMEIPNLRDKSQREQYRNDTACTDPNIAGDQLLPVRASGTPEIDDSVYEKMYEKWREEVKNNTGYTKDVYLIGSGTETDK